MNAAHLEVTGAVVRVFAGAGGFGDPYELALSVVGDEGVATLKGLSNGHRVTKGQFDAIFAALREAGFHAVRWTRKEPSGDDREVRFALARPGSERP